MGQEALAVGAQPPALSLEAVIGLGRRERLDRLAGGYILLREEDRDMLADDLLGSIAMDPDTAGIPTRNVAGRIQHEHRVVGDAVKQHAQIDITALKRRRL